MYIYIPCRDNLCSSTDTFYYSYGIKTYAFSLFHFRQITYIPDVFLHIIPALALCLKCTRHQLSPIHLNEVIYDYISLY